MDDAVSAAGDAVEAFIADYPRRLHFVFEFNPEVDVTAEPYWVEGMWHDTQSTFIRFRRVLEDEIVVAGLLPDGTARVLPHEVLGEGLVIRVDGVVPAGILGVGALGGGAPWRMRGEAEPWQVYAICDLALAAPEREELHGVLGWGRPSRSVPRRTARH